MQYMVTYTNREQNKVVCLHFESLTEAMRRYEELQRVRSMDDSWGVADVRLWCELKDC
jgi:hypothetical protein